jgi:hypothetical protein
MNVAKSLFSAVLVPPVMELVAFIAVTAAISGIGAGRGRAINRPVDPAPCRLGTTLRACAWRWAAVVLAHQRPVMSAASSNLPDFSC